MCLSSGQASDEHMPSIKGQQNIKGRQKMNKGLVKKTENNNCKSCLHVCGNVLTFDHG